MLGQSSDVAPVWGEGDGAGRCRPESVLGQSSGVAPAWSEGDGAGQSSPLSSVPNDGRARTAPGHGKRQCSGRAPGTGSRELERSVGACSGRSGHDVQACIGASEGRGEALSIHLVEQHDVQAHARGGRER